MAGYPISGSEDWALPLKEYIDTVAAGKSVELRVDATHIQWRQTGGLWANLIALSSLKGTDGIDGTNGTNGTNGLSPELRVTATHVQWRVGTGAWTDLILLSTLKGTPGEDGTDGTDGTDANVPDDILRVVRHDGTQWPVLTGPGVGFYVSDVEGVGSPVTTAFGFWVRKKG